MHFSFYYLFFKHSLYLRTVHFNLIGNRITLKMILLRISQTGHGGEGFLKFQNFAELASNDFADAIAQMKAKKRFNEMFIMVDTCHGASLFEHIRSENVVGVSSSSATESSYGVLFFFFFFSFSYVIFIISSSLNFFSFFIFIYIYIFRINIK